MIADLAIIIPTLNEKDNIQVLAARIRDVLRDVKWEVIFVDDDSVDGTREIMQILARTDDRFRYIHRIDRAGLSSACIEGIASTSAPFIAVMDADLQHDEHCLPIMLNKIKEQRLDVVIGTRYSIGGSVDGWSRNRIFMSRFANFLAKRILKAKVSDPMTGFFIISREYFLEVQHKLTGRGFKILLD